MDTDMAATKQNKVKINATISPRLRDKALALSDGNFSNFVETAIAYYVGALDTRQELKQREAEEAIKSKKADEHDLASALLKLAAENQEFLKFISAHPELLQEIIGPKTDSNNDTVPPHPRKKRDLDFYE